MGIVRQQIIVELEEEASRKAVRNRPPRPSLGQRLAVELLAAAAIVGGLEWRTLGQVDALERVLQP